MHKLIDRASVGLEVPDELLAIRPHMPFRERSGLTSLAEGQQVIVDVVEGRKGLEAARVRLV
jgi:hypothetical protein